MMVPLLRSENLARMPHIRHGFTTRDGGVSSGPFASLNLGTRPGELPEALGENWSRVAHALGHGRAEDVALLSQVHGDEVVCVDAPQGPHRTVAEADGAFTTVPGVILTVRVADCVPVLFGAPWGVGVAHAGWRGAASGVAQKVALMLATAGGDSIAAIRAAVGPHISSEVYEVGEEVVEALRKIRVPDDVFLRKRPGARPTVDLGSAVEWQLREIGVKSVERVKHCTVLDRRFFSHRRDGAGTGRSAGVIVMTGRP